MTSNNKKIGIVFYNESSSIKHLFIEPACFDLELDPQTEYRIEAEDNEYRIELSGDTIILYLEYKFSVKIYKRRYSKDIASEDDWILDIDFQI